MDKVRVGVIGVGSIADAGHLPNYAMHPDVELVAFADQDSDRLKAMGAKYGVTKLYDSAEALLTSEKLDAVSICTWNKSHVPIAKMAVERGVDILVEKPLGVSYAETVELDKAVKAAKRVGMVGMTHRYRNESRALKEIVESGALGNIYYIKAKILRQRGTPTGWFTDFSKSGGGPLMDIGVHALDLAWWIAGQPEAKSVYGQLTKGIGNYQTKMMGRWRSSVPYNQDLSIFDVEDFATALIRFRNGVVLSLEVSWALNGPQDDEVTVQIFGDKGGVSLAPLAFYSEKDGYLLESSLLIQQNNAFEREIDHFVQSVRNRTTPISSIEQGSKVVQMLEAITVSSKEEREVVL